MADTDVHISGTYMSLYGATAITNESNYSIEASDSAQESNALNFENIHFHNSTHTTPRESIVTKSSLSIHCDTTSTAITYQSIDEALFELKFRRKSTLYGTVGTSPISRAIFNMLAGAGVVGLPVTYKNSGLTTGIITMIVVAVLSVYTLRLQIQTGKKVKCEDYERLVSKCFGSIGYYLISFCILIFDIGASLTYTIILGNSARDVMDYLFGGFWGSFEGRQIVISIIYLCLILPFCIGRNFEFIEKVSALAIFVVVLMIVVVIALYYKKNRFEQDIEITPWISNDYIDILSALGTISFAFIQHDLAFLVYKTLKNNTLKRYTILAFLGMTIQCFLCVTMAVYGYLSFGNDTNDDILTNYTIGNVYVLGIRILYTFRMAFVFPTAFYVVRHICYAIVFRGRETYEHAPRYKQIIFTLVPWLCFLITGLFVDNLGFVMSLAGLLSALNIAFVLPCLCHLKIGTKYSICFWNAPYGEKWSAFIDTFPCVVLVVFGIVAGGVGSIGIILEGFYGHTEY